MAVPSLELSTHHFPFNYLLPMILLIGIFQVSNGLEVVVTQGVEAQFNTIQQLKKYSFLVSHLQRAQH